MTLRSVTALQRLPNWIRFSLWLFASAALSCLAVSAPAEPEKQFYAIPEGMAWRTLKIVAKESKVDVVFARSIVRGVRTNSIRGDYSVLEAFERLLEGTALGVAQDKEVKAYTVFRRPVEPTLPELVENQANTDMNPKITELRQLINQLKIAAAAATTLAVTHVALPQDEDDDDIYELSPFTVDASEDNGYRAAHTLAGTRIRTDLKNVGSAISVITEDFLEDTAATDNESLLVYTLGTEVAGPAGNFGDAGAGPILNETFENASTKTRVRGLTSADNTIDFQLTRIPWDSYNVDRIDIQRGPNAILFGFGSPAGIINASRVKPKNVNDNEVGIRFDNNGSIRLNADFNRVLIEDQLSVRVALLNNEHEYRQDPAYSDDRRVYLVGRYKPSFLQSESFTTTINASYEHGEIDANRPRSITPIDRVTPWFAPVRDGNGNFTKEEGLGKALVPVDLAYARDFNIPGIANGQRYSRFRTGEDNPDYLPGLNNAPQHFGGTSLQFDAATGQLGLAFQHDPRRTDYLGLGPDGNRDGNIRGHVRLQPVSVRDYMDYADEIGLPFVDLGQYKNFHVQDPGLYDFWNTLLDGPNKWESEDWDHVNFSFAQTFANNSFGYEVVYDRQDYDSEQERYFNNDRVVLGVDMSATIAEYQVNPNDPTERYTYTENPNAGRAFVTGTAQFTNGGSYTTRESTRLTVFARHDFTKRGDDSWIRRLLGKHDLTGLLSTEESDALSQSWQAFATDDAYGAIIGQSDFRHVWRQLNISPYLGGSLLNVNGASNAAIPGIKGELVIPSVIQQRYFDATWNAPNVDPGAPYTDYQNGNNLNNSTQSENPANYVGWITKDLGVLNARNGDRDALTRDYVVSHEEIDSEALVLQSQFWDGAVIGMYGWRQDEDVIYRAEADRFDDGSGRLDFSTAVIAADADPNNSIDIQSKTWSLALHANKLFGLDEILPLDVRFYYSTSENFRPAAGRVDLYGQSLTPPKGSTIDRSVLLSTRDNRYSLRITKYETKQSFGTADNFGNLNYYLGQMFNRGDNAADRYEFNIDGNMLNGPRTDENTYEPRPGQTQAEADAEEAAAVAGWRAFQSAVLDLSEEIAGDRNAFYHAWGSDPNNTPPEEVEILREPAGFAITQDAVSRGYEFELTASPTDNWRITANAAKTEAVRDNIGGDTLIRHLNLVEDRLENTPAGNLRLSSGDVGASTTWEAYQSTFKGSWELIKLREGTKSDELREWRFNLVTNYSFNEGALKGWNVGGGYRWQDDVVIGYPILMDSDGLPYFDLDNPYNGPTESNTDLWIGYERQLGDNILWRAQLNIRNVFADKEVIPISTQPDGTVAGVRLGSTTAWTFSNSFSF